MTYRAELDILLHLHSFSTLIFRKQGLVKIRAFIFYLGEKGEQLHAHPYSIIKKKPEQRAFDSYIDEANRGYYSHSLLVSYDPDEYPLQEACLFRAYIPVDQLDQLQLTCVVELLYCQDYLQSEKSVFEIYGQFEGRITKPSKLADYVPITFDQFEGCTLKATYHSTILEFKFIKQEDDEDSGYYDFWSYMEAITLGFQKANIRRFYGYYRNRIEDEFVALQQMIAQMRKATGEPELPRLKFTRNAKLQNDIDWLANSKSAAFSTEAVNKLIESIMQEFTVMKGVCYKCWNEYIEFVVQRSSKVANHYRKSYRQRVIERLKTNVFSHVVKGKDWTVAKYNNCGVSNLEQAEKQRNKDYGELWAEQFSIQNVDYFQDQHKAVKIFEQSYVINPNPAKSQNLPLLHVFVLVHGFQASHKDFCLVKNYLLSREQPTEVLLSNVNQGRTSFNIETLGSRLAVEVADFLNNRLSKQKFRLSFIGHSMGGVIIRTALRHLERFWPYLYTYISFSTPHLGYLGVSSKVIEAGLWYLNNWEKCDSIKQLMLADSADPVKSFMYRLSEEDVLRHFKNVALVSSYQDGFVSHDSARVEKSAQLIQNSNRKDRDAMVLSHMADNILSTNIQNLYRIDVVFQIEEKNIDSFVGRTGHIKFLSDSNFLKTFINTFDHLFK